MRYLYTVLFYLALPVVVLRLLWRSIKQPAYRHRVAERFGLYTMQLEQCIWFHAVSVGEVIAAIPLIKTLKQRYPEIPFVVTTMTPTGAERVQSSLANYVTHLFLPYDLPDAMERFLNATNPMIGIMMETELWPNLFAACRKREIPVCLMNARLSSPSSQGYQRIYGIVKDMLQGLTLIAANETADAQRFIALGANPDSVVVTGNIKFDLELPADLTERNKSLRQQIGDRFVWIAASTHQGEEEKILYAHEMLLKRDPQALLILVPRHPNRFLAVAKMSIDHPFSTVKRSQGEEITNHTQVYLGDTMGELLLLYSVADIAFVGGSLVPHGGHNMLEPAVLQKAIFTGPHLKNFVDISKLFVAEQALIKVENEAELATQLLHHHEDKLQRETIGRRAYSVVAANRGALNRQIRLLEELLSLKFVKEEEVVS